MGLLESIAIETQATVAAVLVLLIITALEIIDFKRSLNHHRQNLLSIADGTVTEKEKRTVPLFCTILEILFGLAAFVLFGYGMMYLIVSGMPVLAAVAAVSAFIAFAVPLLIWNTGLKADKETEQALEVAKQKRLQAQRQKPATATTERAPNTPTVAEKTQAPGPAQTPKTEEPTRQTQAAAQSELKTRNLPKPNPAHGFPQDSMLRRHFITQLAATVKPYVPTRPTDSMLRRHYDALPSSRMQAPKADSVSSAKPVTAPLATPERPTSAKKCCHKTRIPQDSMLRRHFLTTLSAQIESRLGLAASPTDSMLRRHFETMRPELIAAELQRYLES